MAKFGSKIKSKAILRKEATSSFYYWRRNKLASILIVEDEFSLVRLYELVLTSVGHEILAVANNGEEAVQKYKNLPFKPDIIIMDHRMPIKNGNDATEEILEINREAKIIFASADREAREKAEMMGVQSFKTKPFSNEKLIKNIEKALKRTIYSSPT